MYLGQFLVVTMYWWSICASVCGTYRLPGPFVRTTDHLVHVCRCFWCQTYIEHCMSCRRRREGLCNCVEHHFSQVDQPMSKFGMHFYGMGGPLYTRKLDRWPNKDFVCVWAWLIWWSTGICGITLSFALCAVMQSWFTQPDSHNHDNSNLRTSLYVLQ